ncbi:MAG: flagellar basal-body rod protein FlgF [Hyphomicrobium sp.]|nr:flagellar basal-body rod protein FlgF [Hyphomicrobium sp.]
MQSSVYVALSAQKTLLKRLDSIANNVANVSTPGYRSEEIAFSTLVSDRTSDPVSFAMQGKDYLSTRSGALTRTDSPLDLAIAGDAWFAIETAQGFSYTRDGRFQMSANGDLVTVTGDRVLDSGGAGLQLNPAGGQIVVARDGSVTQDGRTIGAVGLFQIPESANLRRAANGSVVSDQPAVPQLDFNRVAVAQGFIERSNVDPVLEMTRLIGIQRAFDSITNTVSEVESSMNEAIRSLAG